MKIPRLTTMPFLIAVFLPLILLPIPTIALPTLEHVRLGEARLRVTPENLAGRSLETADAFASADGFSLVEIVFNDAGFFGPGNMTLTIVGGTVAENGGVNIARCGTRGATSVAHSVPLGDGTHEAHSWYRAPDEFNRGSDSALTFRTITVHLSYDPDGAGAPVTVDVFIELSRPPLLFVHGLWSSEETWSMDLVDDSRIPVRRRVDYSDTSADSFAENVANQVIRTGVEAALAQSDESLNRVAARVDLVGHSMGGLLGRIRTTETDFLRPSFCNSGSIRKIVTLDSPHEGSPLADLLHTLSLLPLNGPGIRAVYSNLGLPIDQGAILDLTVGSPALLDLQAVPISSHAIVGTGGSDVLSLPLIGLWTLVAFFDGSAPSEVFQAFQHDLIVPRPSQEGGLSSGATTPVSGLDGLHFGVPGNTGSNVYGARIFQLLDLPSANAVWSNFPAGSLIASAAPLPALRQADTAQAPTGDAISITSPAPSTQVEPGATIHVVVEPSLGVTLTDLVVVGPGATMRIGSPPWEVDLLIPATQLGLFSIQASAKTSGGVFLFSQAVSLEALPAATIQNLRLAPDPAIVLGVGGRAQLILYASYSDGVERKVDPAVATWSSSSSATIAVNSLGVLESHALGNATISATIAPHSDGVLATAVRFVLFEDGFETADGSRWTAIVN